MTKRKVTDLLPTEAILISSDAERDAILNLMDEAGWLWNTGDRANYTKINNAFPYALAYKFNGNDGFPKTGIRIVDFDYKGKVRFYPASDFIPTEAEKVDDSKRDWYIKLLAKLKRIESGELLLSDYIEEVELKTRNTQNQ